MLRRALVLAAALALVAVPLQAQAAAVSSPNMSHIANLRYELNWGQTAQYSTDLEFATIGGRDYAFGGTYRSGLQIVDITDPTQPQIAGVYDCSLSQGDTQVFSRGERTYVTYTSDYTSGVNLESGCMQHYGIATRAAGLGTFIVDVTNPADPQHAAFVPIPKGSHNQTVHPSGNYLYNSNSDGSATGSKIEVFDISDLDAPRLVTDLALNGSNSHDVTFSADGTRAYTAALDHTEVIDSSDPAAPRSIGRIVDPAIDIHHQADPVTIDDPLLGERDFLIVTDELLGGSGNFFCPGGGLHVYDITGANETNPVKVGFWEIPEVRVENGTGCTSHVLRLYPDQGLMTIAWYGAGVRVVDISGLAGVSAGVAQTGSLGAGMREVGFFQHADADTWSAKAYRFEEDGSFYLFANDISRGFDVYRYEASAPAAADGGTWLTPRETLDRALARRGGLAQPTGALQTFCMLDG